MSSFARTRCFSLPLGFVIPIKEEGRDRRRSEKEWVSWGDARTEGKEKKIDQVWKKALLQR